MMRFKALPLQVRVLFCHQRSSRCSVEAAVAGLFKRKQEVAGRRDQGFGHKSAARPIKNLTITVALYTKANQELLYKLSYARDQI
jgi:hypothetical protein